MGERQEGSVCLGAVLLSKFNHILMNTSSPASMMCQPKDPDPIEAVPVCREGAHERKGRALLGIGEQANSCVDQRSLFGRCNLGELGLGTAM